jgi:phosphatidylinositol alpha 1,6-mannosyltransferase
VSDYLRSHDHAVQIIAPKPKPHGGEYNGTKVVGVPKVSLQGFHVGIPTKSAVRAEVRTFQPDIIHFASPVSKLGNVGLKAAARLGIPTVAVYQTDVAQYAKRFAGEIVDRSSRKEIKWLKEGAGVALESLLGERIADLHNRADLTLAPSRSAVQRLIDFGVEPSKIKLWARGVDTELFTPERTTQPQVVNQRRAWRGDTERLVVGYVGRLAPEKSVHRLEALKKLRDIQLGEALADAYAAFDLFVHTGAEETFGQTLQEAMATGLPVVAPAAGGPLDIVNNSVTGLLYSHDSDEQLVSSVETIIKDEALRRSMGNAGLQKVAGRTWDALGAELRQHYTDVLRSARRKI